MISNETYNDNSNEPIYNNNANESIYNNNANESIYNEDEKSVKTSIETISKYNSKQLNIIRETIEGMTKFNQIAVLRILKNTTSVIINENKYGIHINLSEINDEIINELLVYINYVNEQEIELNNIENKKNEYKNIFFENNTDIDTK